MARIAVTPCARPADYDAAVRRVGGDPWVPTIGTDLPVEIVRRVDGVLLTGGDDVDPAYFSEPPHPSYSPAEPGRDAFELDLAHCALSAGVPVLAICRGMQVLNVACGGNLIQDIPSEPGQHEPHSVYPPATLMAHEVGVVPGSRLDQLLGKTGAQRDLRVNSRHHQAARAVGTGLAVSAQAPDGIIEALEAQAHPFCLAVQWHPESFHHTGDFDWLFRGFMAAATFKR